MSNKIKKVKKIHFEQSQFSSPFWNYPWPSGAQFSVRQTCPHNCGQIVVELTEDALRAWEKDGTAAPDSLSLLEVQKALHQTGFGFELQNMNLGQD